jgi:protein-ribulosamine 3-kinase
MWEAIAESIGTAEGRTLLTTGEPSSIGGGYINDARRLTTRDDDSGETLEYFVKVNDTTFANQFEAEAKGLEELRAPNAIRVPRPVCRGEAGNRSFIVLEFIELGRGGDASEQLMGERLAALHRTIATDGQFGWHRDNAIGATLQVNTPSVTWLEFFRDRRLRFQFNLAAKRGRPFRGAEAFLDETLPALLAEHQSEPSLLHGDLWGGNAGYDREGNPVLFDPAVYYGDRETDLAFTRMFGGFGAAFYSAYDNAWPLPEGHQLRASLYNLYNELNHFNLFGGGYGTQSERTMSRLQRSKP